MKQIEAFVKVRDVASLMGLDIKFQSHSQIKTRCKYLSYLTIEKIYEKYQDVLNVHNNSPFTDFT